MESPNYHPEPYWSRVAKEMGKRSEGQLIAGDNEPYYDYKRRRFLEMLHGVDFSDRSVLEVGCGPGGNLLEVSKKSPAKVTGVDISNDMLALAKKNTQGLDIDLIKIDGTKLPFDDQSIDKTFTATVLQHNSDEKMMTTLLREACRVTSESVILFEKLDTKNIGDELCMARTVETYAAICREQGFTLDSVDHINIRMSYYVSGTIRKVFNPRGYKEGEKPGALVPILQRLTLPVTKLLDKVFTSKKDVGRLVFKRVK